MKKLENLLHPLLVICLLIGIRAGYQAWFASKMPTPDMSHSLFRYQPPLNDNLLLPINRSIDHSTLPKHMFEINVSATASKSNSGDNSGSPQPTSSHGNPM
jgi:hypothetical protein